MAYNPWNKLTPEEQQRCIDAVRETEGNITLAAKNLGIQRETLRMRLRVLASRGHEIPYRREGGTHWSRRTEFSKYATRPVYDPTADEIREACAAIRATWNDEERIRRGDVDPRWWAPAVGALQVHEAIIEARYAG